MIPYVRRGGIEHVVSVLARRGAEHHQILDSFEGVRASESTLAAQLAAITGEVAASKDDAGYAGTAAEDQSFGTAIAATGGSIGVKTATGTLTDAVAYGTAANGLGEGQPTTAPPTRC